MRTTFRETVGEMECPLIASHCRVYRWPKK